MKSNHRNIVVVILAPLFLFVFMGFAAGDENIVGIENATVIQDPGNGDYHILMRPELEFPDTTIDISRAFFDFEISPQTEDTTFISIRLYPITVDWDAENVSWDFPWSEPGGNFDEVFYGEFLIVSPSEQHIRLDITDLCMRWADGRLPYYGFLLGASRSSWHGFNLIRDGTDPIATLTISYMSISIE
ncbi:MAG: hypothetical protein DRP26_02310 [Candidatus Zixiibacteriota bacterium]|nr:MAG: hypothetical protein DRP26_02310 [candidate division Zixibacteria bacterium]